MCVNEQEAEQKRAYGAPFVSWQRDITANILHVIKLFLLAPFFPRRFTVMRTDKFDLTSGRSPVAGVDGNKLFCDFFRLLCEQLL